MLERCIMVFPEFDNMSIINKIRGKYDPLADHVRPHITLVFPFSSNICADELKNHLHNVLCHVKPFEIALKGITPVRSFGNYLFLNMEVGQEEVYYMHKGLYTGILEPYFPQWLRHSRYHPHMTVGKIENKYKYKYKAAILEVKDISDVFKDIVNKVSVEIIDENQDSIIEMEIELE